jgi:YgiT-type zinc finger domain-containing protein
MDNTPNEEEAAMRCTIQGCPGEYESRTVVHAVKHRGKVIVIDHVPAEVCSVCGDVLFAPETVRRIESLLRTNGQPARNVPLYEFA